MSYLEERSGGRMGVDAGEKSGVEAPRLVWERSRGKEVKRIPIRQEERQQSVDDCSC